MIRTIKYVVSRNLYHPTATLADGMSQISRGLRIQFGTEFFIVFSLVDSSIGGTVDDTVNMIIIDKLFDSRLVGDIQLCDIRIIIGVLRILLLQQLHLIS